jgi:hypothetical protein
MTSKRIIVAICVLSFFGLFYFLKNSSFQETLTTIKKSAIIPSKHHVPNVNVEALEIDGKKVVGLNPGHEKEEIKNLKVANYVSEDWRPNLEKAIITQGGTSVKDLVIKTVDSFVWAQDGNALYVESVIVSLKNENNATTTFRALVDAQTGKILKSWDPPIFDSMNSKGNLEIKLDPRYEDE